MRAAFAVIRWSRECGSNVRVPPMVHVMSNALSSDVAGDIKTTSPARRSRNLLIFAKGTITNEFRVKQIYQVSHLLHYSKLNIQKFERNFALFGWIFITGSML